MSVHSHCRKCGETGGPWCMCWLCEDCLKLADHPPHAEWCPDAQPFAPEVAAERARVLSNAARVYELANAAVNKYDNPDDVPREVSRARHDAEMRLVGAAVGDGWMPTCAACGEDVPKPARVSDQGDAPFCASCADYMENGSDAG